MIGCRLVINRVRRVVAVTLLGTAVGASPVWAGRPLATEDAGVLERGECELESYAGRVKADTPPTVRTGWAQIGCGIGFSTQIALGGGVERSDGDRSAKAALVGKTAIRELTDEQAGFGIAYAVFGARDPSDRMRHEASELKAVVTAPLGGWLVHANVGANYSRADRNYAALWGVALERPSAVGPIDLMAEVFGDHKTGPWVQVGARWTAVPKRVYVDASWGVQAVSERLKQVTVGLKAVF